MSDAGPPPLVVTVPLDRRLLARAAQAGAAVRRDPVSVAGAVLLAGTFVAFVAWDDTLAGHFSLTHDFAYFEQALWSISHGHLDPWSTVQGYYVWQGHAAIVSAWLCGLLFLLWPHPITILVIQAAAMVGCEAVAFAWMRELLARRVASGVLAAWRAQLLLAVGLLLLLADPWIVWTISFDFHWEPVTLFFSLVTLRLAWRRDRAVWLWAALAIVSSNLGATYVVGIGLSCLLAGKAWRRSGAILLALGLAATVVVSQIHADLGSAFTGYSYLLSPVSAAHARTAGVWDVLAGAIAHPDVVVRVLWSHRASLYADVAVGGLLGVVWPWTAGVTVVVLAESGLQASATYSVPGFQNCAALVLVPIGTVAVLGWLWSTRRASRPARSLLGALLILAVAADAVGWSAVWLPRTTTQWLHVSDATASTLAALQGEIPQSAEVIVSQGVAGAFAGRSQVYDVVDPGSFPLSAPLVYVILTPYEGIENLPLPSAWATITELASTPHVAIVVEQNGVWAYRWRPAAGQRELVIPQPNGSAPAWADAASGAVSISSGPPADWRLVANGPGPLLAGDTWLEGAGAYEATLRYEASGPLQLLVLDDTTGQLLGSLVLPPSSRVRTAHLQFRIVVLGREPVYDGWGPFSIDALRITGDEVGVEVSVEHPERAALYSVGVSPARSG